MANYRAEIVRVQSGLFEFDADDDDLAREHLEKVLTDSKHDSAFWQYYVGNSTAPTYYSTKLETWREV